MADQDDVAPAPRAAQDSTIRVRKAGDRLGLSRDLGARGLEGATFAAYRKGTSRDRNIASDPPEATCTTNSEGFCDLLVDSDSEHYLIVQTSEKVEVVDESNDQNLWMGLGEVT